jgi:hypothetical protein
MDKQMLLKKTAAIIATLGETGGSPESMLYIFLDMDMDLWTIVRNILVESKMIQIRSYYVTLTAEGKRIADKLNEMN